MWLLGYIFSKACNRARGNVPSPELGCPRLNPIPLPEPCTPPDMAWLCLSQAGVSALHGTVRTLSKEALALWVQLWGVPELGFHYLGSYFAPRTFSWEKEEEEEKEEQWALG